MKKQQQKNSQIACQKMQLISQKVVRCQRPNKLKLKGTLIYVLTSA
jgi:hypothetical protein